MRIHPSLLVWFGYAVGMVITGIGWKEGRPIAGMLGFAALTLVLLALRVQEAVLRG